MSEMGQKRRFGDVRVTSALPPKTDVHREGAARPKSAKRGSRHAHFAGGLIEDYSGKPASRKASKPAGLKPAVLFFGKSITRPLLF
jgi:hypothetical protein